MKRLMQIRLPWGIAFAVIIITATVTGIGAQHFRKATLAPHELSRTDAPPAIVWDPPALPARTVNFESAEERRLMERTQDGSGLSDS